ncbi:hypothetical protein NQ314_001254 [Rhamnusium bicolor]|uniref:DNA methylase N-4/N-6 domain-containing protein n=1 Tax=Rhamnusium bicolor TaxID=1586634 RepID=A0AAV8ZTQ8_9CUCU|nr:hypothetical protein NQ314_001254 [Rhamnusium bicolor]
MDPQLSLLMANQAKIQNGNIVLDPFVGSGSLLVAAAEFGGYVLGTDIDYLMLHARTRPSRITQKMFYQVYVFIAPYGIREATERVGTSKENYTVSEKHLSTHIPAKIEYGISNIYRDLLLFSAKHLKVGGRLKWAGGKILNKVFIQERTAEIFTNYRFQNLKLFFWEISKFGIPLLALPSISSCNSLYFNDNKFIYRNDYDENGLPSHPCLKQPTEEELNRKHNKITDFREKYFVVREETRKERRMREARIREEK